MYVCMYVYMYIYIYTYPRELRSTAALFASLQAFYPFDVNLNVEGYIISTTTKIYL